MGLQLHPYAILLFISALISAGVGIVAWQRRSAPGAQVLSISMLALTFWAVCYGFVWMNTIREVQIFWLKMMYFGVVAIPLSFLILIAQITRSERLLTRRSLIFLLIEPLVMLVAVWTSDSHHLFIKSSIHYMINGLSYIHWTRGPIYWVNVIYSYLLLLASSYLIVRALFRGAPLFRSQMAAFLMGASVPWLVNIFSLFRLGPFRDFDLTPVAFGISGAAFYYAIFHRRMFDLLPVARSLLIEHISDGLLVLDAEFRILDINPAAESTLNIKAKDVIGKPGLELFPAWTDVSQELLARHGEFRSEMQGRLNTSRYFDIRITPLNSGKSDSGYLILFRDISDRWNAEQKLRQTNEELQVRLREIEQLQKELQIKAIRDPLTDLYNRRYLEETLEQELARAERDSFPISIIMMDADEFKKINDHYGHKAGDHALQSLSSAILKHIRRSDVACRYGGEEFVIVMPNLSLEAAYERAEQIRKDFVEQELFGPGSMGKASLSIGIAAYPAHGLSGEEVLDAADQAMYQAKALGGNRTKIQTGKARKKSVVAEKSKIGSPTNHKPKSRQP